jgi:hypothetical protein
VKCFAIALAIGLAGCASEDPVSATVPVAKSIEVVSGSGMIAMYGTTLPDPLVVHVKDQFGASFAGAVVTFAASGTVTFNYDSVITSASGTAAVTFSFGLHAGVDTVTATVSGISTPALFVETANPGIPGSLSVVSGDAQAKPAGAQLPNDLIVVVRDVAGNPVPRIDVVWTATIGQPSFTRNATGLDGTTRIQFTPAIGTNVVNVSVDRSSLTTAFTITGN